MTGNRSDGTERSSKLGREITTWLKPFFDAPPCATVIGAGDEDTAISAHSCDTARRLQQRLVPDLFLCSGKLGSD
jgi:hypothetical protein